MRTEAQDRASRKNGAKSHGAVTDAGKAASSMNSLRTGVYAEAEIIKGENPADLEALTREFYEEFDPQAPSDRALVDTVVRGTWSLRRLARADAELWNENINRTKLSRGNTYPLGDACNYDGCKTQERLQRRINAINRTVDRTLKILRDLKKLRKDESPVEEKAAPTQAITIDTHEPEVQVPPTPGPVLIPTNDSTLGFAPSNSDESELLDLFEPIGPPTSTPNREKRGRLL